MARSGNSVFRRQHRSTDVLGALVRLVPTDSGSLAVSRRDTPRVLRHGLGIGDRQSRAAVSSYASEGWTECDSGINSPFADVGSLSARIQSHAAHTRETRVQNGRRGGRPTRPPLDQAPGSTGLMNDQLVEAGVVAAPQEDEVQVWTLPHPR